MQYQVIDEATVASHEMVAAIAGKRIVIFAYCLVAAGTVNVEWLSATTSLTGAMKMISGVPHTVTGGNAMDPLPLLRTAVGEALNLELDGAVQVSGWLVYDYR